jgi:hypothetical protein
MSERLSEYIPPAETPPASFLEKKRQHLEEELALAGQMSQAGDQRFQEALKAKQAALQQELERVRAEIAGTPAAPAKPAPSRSVERAQTQEQRLEAAVRNVEDSIERIEKILQLNAALEQLRQAQQALNAAGGIQAFDALTKEYTRSQQQHHEASAPAGLFGKIKRWVQSDSMKQLEARYRAMEKLYTAYNQADATVKALYPLLSRVGDQLPDMQPVPTEPLRVRLRELQSQRAQLVSELAQSYKQAS